MKVSIRGLFDQARRHAARVLGALFTRTPDNVRLGAPDSTPSDYVYSIATPTAVIEPTLTSAHATDAAYDADIDNEGLGVFESDGDGGDITDDDDKTLVGFDYHHGSRPSTGVSQYGGFKDSTDGYDADDEMWESAYYGWRDA